MTREDLQQLRDIAERLPTMDSIGIFSPLEDGERLVFPRAKALPRWRWDLNKPSEKRFDLLVACNVFMYSPEPDRWFRHVLASCKHFLLIDLVRRRRSADSELGQDGDAVRYSACREDTRTSSSFSLESLGDRLLAARTYYGGANQFDENPVHVAALFRGDLAAPVIRIDDFPTGIRPMLPDPGPICDVIQEFERASLEYYLGIVPALLDGEMWTFLRKLIHMRPAVHGFDHAYPKYAPLLRQRNDPYNERTVGTFNEFRGQSLPEIEEKLLHARTLVADNLGREVDVYIPPCNRADRRTGKALVNTGYSYYLSEKGIPFCRLPHLASDFYGRSPDYDYSKSPQVVTLHATWEWDVRRKGDHAALDRLVDHLQERTEGSRALTAKVAGAID